MRETPRSEVLFYKAKSRWDSLRIVDRRRKLQDMKKEQVFSEASFVQLPVDIRQIIIAEVEHGDPT